MNREEISIEGKNITSGMRLIIIAVDLLFYFEDSSNVDFIFLGYHDKPSNRYLEGNSIIITISIFKRKHENGQISFDAQTSIDYDTDGTQPFQEFGGFVKSFPKSFISSKDLKQSFYNLINYNKLVIPYQIEVSFDNNDILLLMDGSDKITDTNAEAVRRNHAACHISRVWKKVSSDPNTPLGRKLILNKFNELEKEAALPSSSSGGTKEYKKYQNRKYIVRTGKRGGKYILVNGNKIYV